MRGSCYGPGSTQKSGSPNKRFLDSYFMLYHFLRPSRQALTSTELSCFSYIIPVGIPVGTIKEFLKNFAPICRSPQMYFRFLYGILQLLSLEFCIGMQKSVNLWFNTLVFWVAWTIVPATKCLMFQVLFTYGLRALKTLFLFL